MIYVSLIVSYLIENNFRFFKHKSYNPDPKNKALAINSGFIFKFVKSCLLGWFG